MATITVNEVLRICTSNSIAHPHTGTAPENLQDHGSAQP